MAWEDSLEDVGVVKFGYDIEEAIRKDPKKWEIVKEMIENNEDDLRM
ncbi:MAG: hypothetical protein KAJ07_00390 [Planctomycetes bacterium]|nr:hypothetical protein [Planctomycetota bacterium]